MRISWLLAGLGAAGLVSAGLAAEPSPYAGQQTRPIKALSQAETGDLLAGRGMGLAKAGELNGYPGPAHVLDMAAALQLSPPQVAAVTAIRDRMSAAARPLRAEIVRRERALNAQFADGTITQPLLAKETEALGDLYGKLRAVHLSAHLETKAVFTPEQVARYAQLRDYTAASAPPDQAMPEPMHHGG
ncbi:MAG: Spy/CpxP family protein refolding chaperone [Alphaproteobacteria bacterium]|nr:Spy/CpxP family protein refolding chaperone [Alphaproteobacteria bacterium]